MTALEASCWALVGPENIETRLAVANEMLQLAEATGDREKALEAHRFRRANLLELGDITAVDVEIEAHARLAEELRQAYYLWWAAFPRAMRSLLAGRFEEGERLAREALAIGRRARNYADQFYHLQLFGLRREQGQHYIVLAITPRWSAPASPFHKYTFRAMPTPPLARSLYSAAVKHQIEGGT